MCKVKQDSQRNQLVIIIDKAITTTNTGIPKIDDILNQGKINDTVEIRLIKGENHE